MLPWKRTHAMTSLPVAPALDQCKGPEFLFVIATGTPVPSERNGLPWWQLGLQEQVDLAHLDATDFWRRGGPVCWGHGEVVGRTLRLRYDPAQQHLMATMRFAATPQARWVQREVDGGVGFGASIAFRSNVLDEELQIQGGQRRLLIRKATLDEWSIVNRGRDQGAVLLGQVVFTTNG